MDSLSLFSTAYQIYRTEELSRPYRPTYQSSNRSQLQGTYQHPAETELADGPRVKRDIKVSGICIYLYVTLYFLYQPKRA